MVANNGSNGELKLKKVANPMDGGEEVAKIGSLVAVANSENSPQNGKRHTKETNPLSPERLREQSLQILRDSLDMVKGDGVVVAIERFTSYKSGKSATIIVLEDVDYAGDDFIWAG